MVTSSYRSLSASELATLAVQMERDQLRGEPAPELPEALTALLPAEGRRSWRPGRRVTEGVGAFEAALAGRAHGWPLREVSRASRRRLGREVTRALDGVYTAPAASERPQQLILWVFRSGGAAREYIGALHDAGEEAALVAGRENLVITGADARQAQGARAMVLPWLSDLLGPEGAASA